MTASPPDRYRFTPPAEADGWTRLLADVTGQPDFASPLIAALSRPLPTHDQHRLDELLADDPDEL